MNDKKIEYWILKISPFNWVLAFFDPIICFLSNTKSKDDYNKKRTNSNNTKDNLIEMWED